MNPGQFDVAQVRLDNALRLFNQFVNAASRHPDAATLRSLERRFVEQIDIQPNQWSQIKARSRQIGELLARQFEQRCRKPRGWMDAVHDDAEADPAAPAELAATPGPAPVGSPDARSAATPQDDDERFLMGLVLTYYRRNPQRARTRLLDLLGDMLDPSTPAPAVQRAIAAPAPPQSGASGDDLWARTQAGVARLKPKR